MIAKGKAFLASISFVQKSASAGGTAQAFIHLEDDADLHPFKIAISPKMAREFSKVLEERDNDNEEGRHPVGVTIVMSIDSLNDDTTNPFRISLSEQVENIETLIRALSPEEQSQVRMAIGQESSPESLHTVALHMRTKRKMKVEELERGLAGLRLQHKTSQSELWKLDEKIERTENLLKRRKAR